MGKLKTKKGVSKRFKLSKRKKIKYSPGGKSHLATGKKPKKLRSLRRARTIKNKNMAKYLKRTLPYG
jgi:large subunit ribosomal protein L35